MMEPQQDQQKEMMLQAIETFEQANIPLSTDFKSKLAFIKNQVESLTSSQFLESTSLSVTGPITEQPHSRNNVKLLMHELYPEMEKLAARSQDEKLMSAANQLKGVLGFEEVNYPE